ncbi:hypothetical protein OO007_09000 [Cocleimonas sp. KMM 6892]|uniref:hypothetical protein n=1 Tax=unclassified Cocleimonas TaxID=2639732 RepID=UPI002DB7E506|nr:MULTISPECIES: hypothetical protein [unclassified Cocleimonas]MEB8432360.1 hypothetical protein [Cocleimonas sp. KMM 6892]MEC4714554.1 hypothetical protein [Cocleimonas sp. KMM 6895]MEC4744632.1 hypothetical protein [Cocleimonas sp. KMM 6896]
MKYLALLLTLLLTNTLHASPNNVTNPPRYFSNNSPVPYNNNYGSNWNMPNMNWGNGNGYNNQSNWNMPSMNWGNGNGYNNGNNWNMPNFNWGNNGGGNNWNMPSMNWGNNNGYGSNWNMPNMNWGNNYRNGYNNGSNWGMPNFNWNNQQGPWNNGPNRYYNDNRFSPLMQQRPVIQPRFAPKPLVNPNFNQPVPQKPATKIMQNKNEVLKTDPINTDANKQANESDIEANSSQKKASTE